MGLTWEEIAGNRDKYTDDVKIAIDGQELTVGELRKGFVPQADFTRAQQKQAEQFRGELSKRDTQLQEAQSALTQALQRAGQPVNANANDPFAAYRQDPTFGPLVAHIDRLNGEIGSLKQGMKNTQDTIWANGHLQVLERIKSKDKDLNHTELLQFAGQRGIVNLDDAYTLMTVDKQIAAAKKEAREEGYEKGKKEARLPVIPSGSSGRMFIKTPEQPKTLDEAVQAAANDPEILQGMSPGV